MHLHGNIGRRHSKVTHEDDRTARRAVLTIVPCVVLAALVGSMAFPILPIYLVRADVALPLIGVILAANRVGRIVATPLAVAIADRIGGRRTLVIGLATQFVVMLLYILGVATSRPVTFFLLGRLLQGPSSACVFVVAQTLALRAGGARHGGRVMGFVRAAMAAGVPLGLVLGGVFSDLYGATVVFAGAGVAAVGAVFAAMLLLANDSGGASSVLVSLPETLRQFANRRLTEIGALSFAASFAAHGVVLTTLVLLVRARGISLAGLGAEGTSGVMMGLMVILIVVGSPSLGVLGDRMRAHGRITMLGIGALIPALILTGLASTPQAMAVGVTLVGVGAAALGPSLLALVNEFFPIERQGRAVAAVLFYGDLGGLLGPIVGTLLIGYGASTPYLASAALVLCAMPVATILAWRETQRCAAGRLQRDAEMRT